MWAFICSCNPILNKSFEEKKKINKSNMRLVCEFCFFNTISCYSLGRSYMITRINGDI